MPSTSEDEYADFVHAHWKSTLRTAYLLTGDHHLAEDLTQSAFTKALLSWSRVRQVEHPAAYVRKIVVNQAISWRRRRSSAEAPTDRLSDRPRKGHEESVTLAYDVWAAILRLPARQRAVIVLRYYEDLSEAEIAAVLGMARGTVKSHANAARRALSALLPQDATNEEVPHEPR